jgi:hypothetical protein
MKNLKESQGWNSRTDKKFVYTRHDYYFFNLPCSAASYFFNVVHLVCVVLFVVGLSNFFLPVQKWPDIYTCFWASKIIRTAGLQSLYEQDILVS